MRIKLCPASSTVNSHAPTPPKLYGLGIVGLYDALVYPSVLKPAYWSKALLHGREFVLFGSNLSPPSSKTGSSTSYSTSTPLRQPHALEGRLKVMRGSSAVALLKS